MATQTVPIRSGRCYGCGRPFTPYDRRACVQRFCSASCRTRAWKARQAALDFTPPPAPVPPVQDQRVPREERLRLGRMSRAILDRLRMGGATNRELAAMFEPAAAWRSRLSDVRKYLQHQGETVRRRDYPGGLVHYWIEVLR